MKAAGIKRLAEADLGKVRGVGQLYLRMRQLSKINGPDVSRTLLDDVMYRSETLPPLGKEYWWFLFFGRSGGKPVQLMLLIFKKYGKRMLFDGKPMSIKDLGSGKFRAVTAGWVYDGKKMRDLGDTNAVVKTTKKRIISEISGGRLEISGAYPDYRIRLGKTLDLRTRKGRLIEDKDAYGIMVPPFGMGWVDAYPEVAGKVLGKIFRGTAHLQKVFGVSIFGPFHWGRVIFEDDSVATFFSLKTGKGELKNFCWYMIFYDKKRNEIIRFKRPSIRVSKTGDGRLWTVDSKDKDKTMRLVLRSYAKREFRMKGGGSQVYVEYAVLPQDLRLKTVDRTITLKDLGKGVGTLEDAYW